MSSQPYDKSQIITLITEYYHLLFTLRYYDPEDVDFPPPEGREIDMAFCQSLNLSPKVVSLMQHIPCPTTDHTMLGYDFLLPNSHANTFSNKRFVENSRDPETFERLDYLLPTDIALTVMGDEGQNLVLDTSKNTLRVVQFNMPDEEDPGLYDCDPACPDDHYTRFPIQDPVEVLQSCIDKVRRLEWLPRQQHGGGVIDTGGEQYEKLKKIMIEEYRWGGDEFKKEEWKKDCKGVWLEIEKSWKNPWDKDDDNDSIATPAGQDTNNMKLWSKYMCWQQ